MFLTKKSLVKILIMIGCYVILGSICIWLSFKYAYLGLDGGFWLKLGIILYAVAPIFALLVRFSEGKAKLIDSANKLIRKELKPAEFIRNYEKARYSPDLITCKPSFEVLQMVVLAYDSLDDRERSIAAVDEMIALADEKKKARAKLLKASLLYSYDKNEEAEAIFLEAQNSKLDLLSNALKDNILKSDRAMAMGDYRTVEAYCIKALEQSFPKLDNLNKLILHFKLGEVYKKLGERDRAIENYRYCAENGGETAIRYEASVAMENLLKA